jgi:hypothetical protein
MRDGATALGEDHRAAQVELDRRLRRDLGQLVGGQGVEGRALRQKAGDLAQASVQLALRALVSRII